MDSDSITRRNEVAPRISEELKTWLIKRLDEGLTARQVFEEHKNVWYEGWTKNRKHSKDNSLLLKHVRFYEYQKNFFLGTSIKMHWWVWICGNWRIITWSSTIKMTTLLEVFLLPLVFKLHGKKYRDSIILTALFSATLVSVKYVPRLCNTCRTFYYHTGWNII